MGLVKQKNKLALMQISIKIAQIRKLLRWIQ